MKQVLVKGGAVVVEEIPAPSVEPGTVLVRVQYSCISIGTEMSGIKAAGLPVWKKALQQPEKVKKVLQMVAAQGLSQTQSMVTAKLGEERPTGYSAAGIVVEVGAGINDLKPGDRVACAGAQCAFHAEMIRVPRNLAVPVPEGLDLADASTATIGAIAMQGLRRAQPTLGESFVVIGLGILGQLTAQMLKANGCRVIGTDLDQSRINIALELGMDFGVHPENGNDIDRVVRITEGIGADGVIITAASPSDAIVSIAFKMCRKKGRVVLVGDVGLNLNREDFYQKELDFFISSSYGPGRYDNNYEEKGLDYPVAFVRWTENRNMAEYLRLLTAEKVKVKQLIHQIYPLDQAPEAYERLKSGSDKPLMILLSYPEALRSVPADRKVTYLLGKPKVTGDKIRIAVIGAGNFAKGMHLPNLKALSNLYHLQAVMSRTGHNASVIAKQYKANYATTDYQQILNDPEIDAVLIATRHNLHASMTLEALRAGKHVLVEKPLALNQSELEAIESFYASQTDNHRVPILLTGYNRRFSIYARRIKEIVKNRTNPMIINYRMNVGYIPLDHWVHTEEGGGRNIGEACHIYDLFTFLTDSQVANVEARSISPKTGYYGRNDNFVATIAFTDGSVATLTYTALGSTDYPKEQMDIYVDGKVIVLNDYKKLQILGAKVKGINNKIINKGQKDELEAFVKAVKTGEWVVPLWEQTQVAEISYMVENRFNHNG
jgi:predicted dehydrogenase/threonine dehydrogenase-like Zn-dependent dehydrogenase